MKFLLALGSMKNGPVVLLVTASVALSTCSPARAVEIAYEGFGYPAGYLSISDASSPELVDLGITDAGIYDGIDDGTAGFYDHDNDPVTPDIQDTVLGDPARAGGSGSWVSPAGWIRRAVTGAGVTKIDDTATLSYSDSLGNSLDTTMGKPAFFTRAETWRAFDASTVVDPAYPGGLTMPNTGSENTINVVDFEVPTLGKHGTVVWMSFLADQQLANDGVSAVQLWNKRDAVSLTETPQSRTAGVTVKADADWRFFQTNKGEEANHDIGTSGDVAGSLDAVNAAGDVFLVAKFDYSATSPGGDTDGWADITVWVNPDLNAEPDVADAGLQSDGYIPFNALYINSPGIGGLGGSSLDELRLGTTFADVAPFTPGGGAVDGDYNDSGLVEQGDLDLVLLNWGATWPPTIAGWVNQQPTDDGVINQNDLDGVLLNWGNSSTVSGAVVPEPTSMVLLLSVVSALCLLRRR